VKRVNIDIDEWLIEHDLTIQHRRCSNCGKELSTTIPVTVGDWVGLVSERHECGSEYDLLVVVKENKDERDMWKDYFNKLSTAIVGDEPIEVPNVFLGKEVTRH